MQVTDILNRTVPKLRDNHLKILNFSGYQSHCNSCCKIRLPILKRSQRNIGLDEISPADDQSVLNYVVVDNSDVFKEADRFLLETLCNERKKTWNRTEQKQLIRVTIFYTLAFFALTIVTFFTIYLA